MKDEKQHYFNLEDALCVALYKAHRLMNKIYAPYLKNLELTYTQFLVMVCLWNHQTLSIKEICDKLELDTGTLTPLIKRLINIGLIEKIRSLQDERVVIISLTKKGKSLKAKAKSLPHDIFNELNMEMNDFIEIRNSVQTVVEKLKKKSILC